MVAPAALPRWTLRDGLHRRHAPTPLDAVRDGLAASLDKDGAGASATVYLDGEPVVDLWGGDADAAGTVPWERDTITTVWSTTKTMTALCVLLLADRGAIDLDAPVATYWPEFAAAGKAACSSGTSSATRPGSGPGPSSSRSSSFTTGPP